MSSTLGLTEDESDDRCRYHDSAEEKGVEVRLERHFASPNILCAEGKDAMPPKLGCTRLGGRWPVGNLD